MTTEQKISAAIIAKVAEGLSVKDAVDAVLGVGTYEALASDIHDAANA